MRWTNLSEITKPKLRTMTVIVDNQRWREFFKTYESLPELWKVKSESYRNVDKRQKAWKRLLEKYKQIDCHATLNTVKERIYNIRTCYRRVLKKVSQSGKSGGEAMYVPSLWYFDLLWFLRDQENPNSKKLTLDLRDEIATSREFKAENRQKMKRGRFNKDINNKKSQFLQKALDYLNSSTRQNNKDDAAVYADAWACSFKKLSAEQQLYAKKAIDEILVLGQLDKLTLNCIAIE